ncbi:RHS repeat-associated core domain-containing protein, partial [Anaeromyxobacter oryzisoli]|uniref:RHS repeat-associated core domain-containing protein n=1 Tax=Anaeromyxobacter oryzisoli TaxID=2925408 RepID=UPI001F5AB36A
GQFWSVKGRRAAMKHVFVGTARVASKLMPPPGWDDVPRGTVDATEPGTTPTTVNNDSGCDPSNYQPQKCAYLPGGDPVLNDYYADAKVRPETYYYHPDHLGSTSWVTDQNARVHERVEYFPYGEVWRDTRSDVGASPVKGQRFLFTGKEIDEETGLYYFGARYYDPRFVRWASPDPLYIGFPERGIGREFEFNLYGYVGGNPLSRADLTGLETVGQLIERRASRRRRMDLTSRHSGGRSRRRIGTTSEPRVSAASRTPRLGSGS